jgi:hypothetical protein
VKNECASFIEYKKNLFCGFCGISEAHNTRNCDSPYNAKNRPTHYNLLI